jgi:DNA-binding MarR family transcriptional regulator
MKHYEVGSYRVDRSVGYLIRRSASLMREQLEAEFASQSLTFVQWVTLMLVRDGQALTPGALCRNLHHDSGAFTRILDHLEQRKLLKRARSGADRRVVQLRVTAAGRRAVEGLLPIVVGRLNEALQDFSRAEVETLAQLLGRLITRLEPPAGERGYAAAQAARP